MAQPINILSAADLKRLSVMLRAYERGELTLAQHKSKKQLPPPVPMQIGKAPSEIDAMSGDTPGSGTVNIWTFDDDGDVAVTSPLVTVTAYNLSSQPVAADTMLQLKRHSSGRMLIDFESCEE